MTARPWPGTSPDPLDKRNPWPLTAQPHIGMAILRTWDGDPSFVVDETIRVIEQAARREERYIEQLPPGPPPLPKREPRWVPEAHHDDDPDSTIAGWDWIDGDTFARDGQVKPENTGQFLVAYDRAAEAVEQRWWRRARRAIAHAIEGARDG